MTTAVASSNRKLPIYDASYEEAISQTLSVERSYVPAITTPPLNVVPEPTSAFFTHQGQQVSNWVSLLLGYFTLKASYPNTTTASSVLEPIRAYIGKKVDEGEVTEQVANYAYSLLGQLNAPFKREVMDVSVFSDGRIFLAWNDGVHHLEAEVLETGIAEFFYCNRQTEDIWSEDFQIGSSLTDAISQKLNLFTQTSHA